MNPSQSTPSTIPGPVNRRPNRFPTALSSHHSCYLYSHLTHPQSIHTCTIHAPYMQSTFSSIRYRPVWASRKTSAGVEMTAREESATERRSGRTETDSARTIGRLARVYLRKSIIGSGPAPGCARRSARRLAGALFAVRRCAVQQISDGRSGLACTILI